ncbi:MBL fold metallo-hydrolase [Streptomyces xanthii]|uniref:MBL fold metallo-hydrolase n=1 Tax=Streptomyces xanthii TaxID=2768069 RepID=A0A7H1BKD7_9ACTN|nr:MBL fold metallo-hydrolase [Streptomyces xanthii]QNS09192.1 MBL fold metallo-hydrolase [Streptomyces xanthii]
MKLAPHLHRLGNDIVACYLVDTDDGITLIDAGLPGHWRDLRRELRSLGKSFDDIRGLVLTHGDTDHIGFAERLRKTHGVPVFVHAADAVRTREGEKFKGAIGPRRLGPTLKFLGYSLVRKNGLRPRYVGDVTEFGDGDVLDLPGSPVIVGMPGHSPGSVAVHVPLADAVFVGDALTTRHVLTGRAGPQPAPFTDDPDLALSSLDRISGLPASWVLPGHGAPWRISPAQVGDAVRSASGPGTGGSRD